MIEPKKKQCKGTSRAKDHKGCGKLSYFRKYGLCHSCYRKWLLNSEEGKKIISKSIITGKKKAVKEKKSADNKRKIENKSIASLIQDARRPFQKLIRIRDHGKQCICCERPLPFNISEYDAGHFLKAELYTGLIFNPNNAHGQTTYCNKYAHGNESGYNSGLISRIGLLAYNKLISVKNSLKTYKWDRYKLIEMKEYYTKELRLVEKGEKDIKEVDFSIGIIKP